ncbi:hypothetical protein GCM10009430_17610 [Aquimarina litoralis]|uniref:Uncharacterized protein n=1 Tax=Aquimarina litoralis TaxID=584605 RepID=A0ABP3TZJ1_9FLAO
MEDYVYCKFLFFNRIRIKLSLAKPHELYELLILSTIEKNLLIVPQKKTKNVHNPYLKLRSKQYLFLGTSILYCTLASYSGLREYEILVKHTPKSSKEK